MVREHCNRKPLHSSAAPENGAGRAMGLANTVCEGELVVLTEGGTGAEGAGCAGRLNNTFLRESMSSWKGS